MAFRHVPQTNGVAQNNSSLLSNDVSREEIDIKIVCVGAANTGKTTFLRYWETGRIPMYVSTTIQMEFHRREMTIEVPPQSYFRERDQNADGTMPSSQTSRSSSSSNSNSNSIISKSHNSNGFSGPVKHFPSSQRLSSTLPNPFGADYAMSPMPLAPFHLCVRRHPLVSLPAIVKVWDIQGQESTKRMTRVFYTGAVAVLIFCELSSGLDSLTSALSWRSDALEKIRIARPSPPLPGGEAFEEVSAPCWLVVNKYDLLPALPAPPPWASRAALDELCARHGFAGWSYTAGRHGANVEETLRAAIDAAVEALPEFVCPRAGAGEKGQAVVQRTRSKTSRRQQGGCCHR